VLRIAPVTAMTRGLARQVTGAKDGRNVEARGKAL